MEKMKVYVLLNEKKQVIRCEGGYSIGNIQNINDWILIDEGSGSRFSHCQNAYFEGGLYEDHMIPLYKYENGEVVKRTEEEIEADIAEIPEPEAVPTQLDMVEAQALYTAMCTDTLLI